MVFLVAYFSDYEMDGTYCTLFVFLVRFLVSWLALCCNSVFVFVIFS